MAPEVHRCPACGRERNRRGEPFDEARLAAHIAGSHDTEHSEVSVADAETVEMSDGEFEEAVPPQDGGRAIVETVRGEETVSQAARANARQSGEALANETELRGRVERLERMVAELSETLEIVAIAAADSNSVGSVEAAMEVHAETDETRMAFESEVAELREELYERGEHP